MNKKLIPIIIAAAVLVTVIMVAVLLPMALHPDRENENTQATTVPSTEGTQGSETTETTRAAEPTETTETTESPTTAPTAEPTTAPTTAPTVPPTAPPTAPPTVPPTAPPTAPPTVPPTAPRISFPYAIPDTTLVIDSLNSYDGLFLEDGSDVDIVGLAAIILRNTGSRAVDYAQIQMIGEKTSYRFVVSSLQAGASIVVQEAGKAPCVQQEYQSITADAAMTDSLQMSPGILKLEDTPDGKLQVTNLTDTPIPCVRLFYKFYMEEQQLYVGGITYVVKVLDLQPGASAAVSPSHYAPGSSRVVMAKTYESQEE